jgi:SAM-dependent methyltransferase
MADHKPPLGARNAHSHMWLFGMIGVAAGVGFLVFAPQLKAVSASLLLFAGFHLVGGFILLASLYVSFLRRWVRRRAGAGDKLDFGWGPGWMNGLGIAAVVCLAGAVMIQVAAPAWWPAALALALLGANFTVGNFIMRSFRRQDHAVLPMVELLSGDSDLVLDAGCGSGRTTIALGRAMRNAKVFAVDRFDAGYIEDGGRALLDRNLRIAGLSDRVTIETADLTALPFDDGDFDSMVSTHVYDHLGQAKQRGLNEAYRVLKPGGRFLMAVWVPGWTMFAVGAVLSFFLTPKSAWRGMAKAAGFELVDEGVCNNAWFVVMQKPLAAA